MYSLCLKENVVEQNPGSGYARLIFDGISPWWHGMVFLCLFLLKIYETPSGPHVSPIYTLHLTQRWWKPGLQCNDFKGVTERDGEPLTRSFPSTLLPPVGDVPVICCHQCCPQALWSSCQRSPRSGSRKPKTRCFCHVGINLGGGPWQNPLGLSKSVVINLSVSLDIWNDLCFKNCVECL